MRKRIKEKLFSKQSELFELGESDLIQMIKDRRELLTVKRITYNERLDEVRLGPARPLSELNKVKSR